MPNFLDPRLPFRWSVMTGTPIVTELPFTAAFDPGSESIRAEVAFTRHYVDLSRLASLGHNWDSYGAAPPLRSAINRAEAVLRQTKEESIEPSRVLPSAEGGVGLCFVRNGRYAHIECLNEGETAVVMSRAGSKPVCLDVPDAKTRKAVGTIKRFLQRSA